MKKYYYHVTEKFWGKQITLNPRITGKKRDLDYEPKVKRICVSSTIEGCLTAVYLYEMTEWNIYRTKRKVIAHKTKDIPDSKITNEFWLKRPTQFVYHGSVRGRHFAKIIKKSFDFFNKNDLLIGDGEKKTFNHQIIIKNQLKKLIKENKITFEKLPKNEMHDMTDFILELSDSKKFEGIEELEEDYT